MAAFFCTRKTNNGSNIIPKINKNKALNRSSKFHFHILQTQRRKRQLWNIRTFLSLDAFCNVLRFKVSPNMHAYVNYWYYSFFFF